MRICLALSFLLIPTLLTAADHRVEELSEAAPEEVSAEIAKLLAPEGIKVVRGTSRTVCEIWLCKEWAVSADFRANNEVLYPFVPGQLIGVARYPRRGADFRDQDIDSGVYTLRYAQQPVDGNHVGTSPTRDFLLLVRAESDQKAGKLDYKTLARVSAEAAGTTHPALLQMQRIKGEGKGSAIRHNEDHDWWIVRLTGKSNTGKKTADLPIELVVVGAATE